MKMDARFKILVNLLYEQREFIHEFMENHQVDYKNYCEVEEKRKCDSLSIKPRESRKTPPKNRRSI
jgi:hypothetical protein